MKCQSQDWAEEGANNSKMLIDISPSESIQKILLLKFSNNPLRRLEEKT